MLRFGRYALPLMAIVLLNIFVDECEMSIYPGLRRRPQLHAQLLQQQPMDVSIDFLNQLMEENARRRLQQQFEQQLQLINLQMARQRQRQERLRERLRQQQLQLQQQQQDIQELSEDDDEDNVDYNNNNNNNNYNNNNNNVNNNENLNNNNNNNNVYEQYDNVNGEFSYKYPKYPLEDNDKLLRQRIQFAVSPLDPRYFIEETANSNDVSGNEDDAEELDSKALDEYEEYVPAESSKSTVFGAAEVAAGKQQAVATGLDSSHIKDNAGSILAPAPAPVTAATFHRIKPQNAAAAAVVGVNIKQATQQQQQSQQTQQQQVPNTGNNNNNNNNMRHDISALIDKLQKEGKSGAILNGANEATLAQDVEQQQMVVRQHLGMVDSDMGMYIVALIAGVSAATTVGLIALGIAWVHSKAKAAADVDYPAYGVTGPNKDISPSGDRKLAQSAQMYHYQHQKQQIIAMENRQAAEGSCGLSDVESDDDNEEGDYTVYECPGLAPTGEMEVKNPLFLDETPVTPSTGNVNNANAATNVSSITQTTAQQPPQQQLGKKAATKGATTMNTSSEAKNNKTKKQDKK